MAITIQPINQTSNKELRRYVKFGIDMYKGNDCFVPPLIFDEIDTLNPDKNPAKRGWKGSPGYPAYSFWLCGA